MIGEKQHHVKRRLLVGGAGLAGVVLGWVVLGTVVDGSSDEGRVASSRPPVPVATPGPALPPAPNVTYVPASRDPFHQIVTVPRAQVSGQSTAHVPAAAQAPPAASTPTTPAPSGRNGSANLELKSIAPDASGTVRATVTVDGLSYSPAKGETFSHGYRLERIDGNCVEVSAQSARAQMCAPATNP